MGLSPRASWIAAVAAALLLVVGTTSSADARGKPSGGGGHPTYVAMGDSYASGNGTFNPDLDASCYRSSDAYAPLVTKQLKHTSLTFVACSGATTSDIIGGQDQALTNKTTYVSISIGGDDIGFTALITACVSSGDSACQSAVDTANGLISGVLPGKLAATYSDISKLAPNAKVVVVGYPEGFDPRHVSCLQAFGIDSAEATMLNGVSDNIDSVISAAASDAGFTYVDPIPAFTHHDVCASTPYLNGFVPVLSGDTADAYHPTKAGYAKGFEPLVYNAFTGR